MTDEKKSISGLSNSQHIQDLNNDSKSKSEYPIDSKTIEELLRANNGQDVDLEFYCNGKLLENSTCFFEVWK